MTQQFTVRKPTEFVREPIFSEKTAGTHEVLLASINDVLSANGLSRSGKKDRSPFTMTTKLASALAKLNPHYELPEGLHVCTAALAYGCRFQLDKKCSHCYSKVHKACLSYYDVEYEGKKCKLIDMFPCTAFGAVQYKTIDTGRRIVFQQGLLQEAKADGEILSTPVTCEIAQEILPCRFGSSCGFGKKCKFYHAPSDFTRVPAFAPPCKFGASCGFGKKCKFYHAPGDFA